MKEKNQNFFVELHDHLNIFDKKINGYIVERNGVLQSIYLLA